MMKHKAFTSALLMALLLIFFNPQASLAQCKNVCESYGTCKKCVETCNSCKIAIVQDPEYPKTINSLPIDFEYKKSDDNTANDTCTSSGCGVKNCNAGKTEYKNQTLPAKSGFCELTPNDSIPAQINCTYQEGFCQTYCSKKITYSCCKKTKKVCTN